MSENGEIYTAGKNFTLPLALTGWTNSTSAARYDVGNTFGIFSLYILRFGALKGEHIYLGWQS